MVLLEPGVGYRHRLRRFRRRNYDSCAAQRMADRDLWLDASSGDLCGSGLDIAPASSLDFLSARTVRRKAPPSWTKKDRAKPMDGAARVEKPSVLAPFLSARLCRRGHDCH